MTRGKRLDGVCSHILERRVSNEESSVEQFSARRRVNLQEHNLKHINLQEHCLTRINLQEHYLTRIN